MIEKLCLVEKEFFLSVIFSFRILNDLFFMIIDVQKNMSFVKNKKFKFNFLIQDIEWFIHLSALWSSRHNHAVSPSCICCIYL